MKCIISRNVCKRFAARFGRVSALGLALSLGWLAAPTALAQSSPTYVLTVTSDSDNRPVTIPLSYSDANGLSDGVTPFTRDYTNAVELTLTAPQTVAEEDFLQWEVDGNVVSTNVTLTLTMDRSHAAKAVYQTRFYADQFAQKRYRGGDLLTVTNFVEFDGTMQALSWTPVLPEGWTITGVSGDGSPQLQDGTIVFAGPFPTTFTPMYFYYTVQVPDNARGPQTISGLVTFQFSDMTAPASIYAYPDNLNLTSGNTDLDFTGDGRSDLAVYSPSLGTWYIKPSGSAASYAVHWGWSGVIPMRGDFDGDGKQDCTVYDPATGYWYIPYSSGSSARYHFGWAGVTPVTGDFDGDGRTDLAVYYPATGTWYVKYSSTGAEVAAHWGWGSVQPVPGDYDGDGKTDFAVYDASAGDWYISFSSGSSVKAHFGWKGAVPLTGDFNGDGRTDLAVYDPTQGNWYIKYSGGGASSFNSGAQTAIHWGWVGPKPVPGDYDGDGITDLAVYDQAAGDWYIRYSSGGSAKVHWGWSEARVPGAR